MSTAKTGVDFVIKVNTGTIAVPIWTLVAGQRGASLNRSTDEADITSKDSAGWHEGLPTTRTWGIDADGLVIEDDTGYVALEDAWRAGTQVQVELSTPAGNTEIGMATITDFPVDMPYDGETTYSISLAGSGALVRVP